MAQDNPILNNPYLKPTLHYATDGDGALNYEDIRPGRRIFFPVQTMPTRQGPQATLFEINELEAVYETLLVNQLRKEVGLWRDAGYPQTTRVTAELLRFWFLNAERHDSKKLFFAQREAIETAVWLNEVADKSNAGTHLLNQLRIAQLQEAGLPRIAFKMATGTGKTVVMASLILYHYFNRQEYRADARFADNFLLVAPGITIRDRLGVLYVDTLNKSHQDISDYYRQRGLVPNQGPYKALLEGLNARLVMTNYHAFEPRTLQGNKKSPFDGKRNADGNKQEAKEDPAQTFKRLLGKFKPNSRLLILNDEAHHCYLPKAKGKRTEDEDSQEENARAAVWFTGLTESAKRFKLQSIYDLSATPYYLSGSGYEAYTLFPWLVSDFGLIEAIESGLVKIPFLPESDTSHELTIPVLRNLYEHVKQELPRKGQKRQKKELKGEAFREEPPKLPTLVKLALDQFYDHYQRDYAATADLFATPPVFIFVCNNTTVSKEVYKYIAGYELIDDEGQTRMVGGKYSLFSNFDESTGRALRKPPTLLIDSDALEESNQIGDDFKKVFAPEIEQFKRDYRIAHPDKSPDKLTDGDILREVVNTVGKPGLLGAHIRCVVSVSMLTEGWDANTVTHILGLRAFGSQLLCEQVAGRALRRQKYLLQAYDLEGNPIEAKKLKRYKEENIIWKFPPEYAHIVGVPFKMFKGGDPPPPPPQDITIIRALPQRQETYEISFPNIIGYRVESQEGEIDADFSGLHNFEIDGTQYPMETTMETAFSGRKEKIKVRSVKQQREQELFYTITKELIGLYFSDLDGKPYFQKFNKLKKLVERWYQEKVVLLNITDPEYKKLLFFYNPKEICDHINLGIMAQQKATDVILPIFNHYNRFGSSRYVHGQTSKEVYPTIKSHVNYVVADTESWEQITAKTLEELDEVESYVKNAFLGFQIPYVGHGKDKLYFPDFIARCRVPSGSLVNLIIEITGMNQDKAEKRWYVDNRWLPAVNAVRDKYAMEPWAFVEIANDIRDIKNQLLTKINSIDSNQLNLMKMPDTENQEAIIRSLKVRFNHIPSNISLADELIAERREESKREDGL